MPAHPEIAARVAGGPPIPDALARCAAGVLPPNVALMQLFMTTASEGEARAALAQALAEHRERGARGAVRHLARAQALWDERPQAWSTVNAVLTRVRHDEHGAAGDEAIRRCAGMFDAAASLAPEGSVALYALGDPALLAAATGEIVERMTAWGFVGPEQRLLDLGCGIGRLIAPLAPRVAAIVGVDIAPAMLTAARTRCAGLDNVLLLQGSGRDLACLAAEQFDLVYAVDSFPYLVQAGPQIVAAHIREAARVLRPGGMLLIFNYSYRGDPGRDEADLSELAAAAGLVVRRRGTRDFTLWDGTTFALQRIGNKGSAARVDGGALQEQERSCRARS